MNFEESAKKLYTLPWQALYDLAVEKQIDGEEIKHKEKTEIIRRVLEMLQKNLRKRNVFPKMCKYITTN